MKTFLSVCTGLLLLTLAATAGRPAASAQEPAKQGAPAQDVEARLTALEAKVAGLEKKQEESVKLVEQTVTFLEKQGKSSQTLAGVLDVCQEQGFAVGENWKSRETLLTGLRAYLADGQAGLPKMPAPAKPATQPAQPARRRAAGQ